MSARSAPAAGRSRASTGSGADRRPRVGRRRSRPGRVRHGRRRGDRHRRPRRARHARPGAVPRRPRAARRRARARAAIERSVARPLGLSVEDAAAAVVRVLSANMAAALRVISVARGHDPRRFALVALGGAGPMHAPQVADELGIDRIVIPRWPGITAALGLLGADVRHDLARGFVPPAGAALAPALDAVLAALEDGGAAAARRRAVAAALVARRALPRPGVRADRAAAGAAGHRRDAGPRHARVPRRPPPRLRPLHADGADRDRDRPLPGHDRARRRRPSPRRPASARPVGSRTVHGVRHAVHDRVSLDERTEPRRAGDRRAGGLHRHRAGAAGRCAGAPGGTLLLERG